MKIIQQFTGKRSSLYQEKEKGVILRQVLIKTPFCLDVSPSSLHKYLYICILFNYHSFTIYNALNLHRQTWLNWLLLVYFICPNDNKILENYKANYQKM